MDGVGLVSCDVCLVGGGASMFWLMELDLVSLKGSAVSVEGFGVSVVAVCLGQSF